MPVLSEMVLVEFAGQECDVKITVLDNGSVFVAFPSTQGYGAPCLTKEKLVKLLDTIEMLEKLS